MGHFGPPNCTKKVPEWAKMTYDYVFYLWEVFYGHFDPFDNNEMGGKKEKLLLEKVGQKGGWVTADSSQNSF